MLQVKQQWLRIENPKPTKKAKEIVTISYVRPLMVSFQPTRWRHPTLLLGSNRSRNTLFPSCRSLWPVQFFPLSRPWFPLPPPLQFLLMLQQTKRHYNYRGSYVEDATSNEWNQQHHPLKGDCLIRIIQMRSHHTLHPTQWQLIISMQGYVLWTPMTTKTKTLIIVRSWTLM